MNDDQKDNFHTKSLCFTVCNCDLVMMSLLIPQCIMGSYNCDGSIWEVDGLLQEKRISSALGMELHLYCTNPSIWEVISNSWYWFHSHLFCRNLVLNQFHLSRTSSLLKLFTYMFEHYIHRGPFYKHKFTSIPTWISNYIYYKMWNEITYPLPNFSGCKLQWLHHWILGMDN